MIEDLNPIIRGWYEYFKHAHWNVFSTLDSRIRSRLRAIRRKQLKISGRLNRADLARWPNAYFSSHGLLFMAELREQELKSLRKVNH